MTFATGFESFAFQTVGSNDNKPSGFGYKSPYAEYKEYEYQREKIRKHKSELEKLEAVLKETERKKALAEQSRLIAEQSKKKAAIIRLLKLEQEFLNEITRLLAVRAMLMQRMLEDEAILIILMMKRRRLRVA